MSEDYCAYDVDPLMFLPKDTKKCIEWIKEARKPAIDKAIEKMENSPYYDIWVVDLCD